MIPLKIFGLQKKEGKMILPLERKGGKQGSPSTTMILVLLENSKKKPIVKNIREKV